MAVQYFSPKRGMSGCAILRRGVLVAAVAASAALSACESPLYDHTDRKAYSLIAERQRQALGAASDSGIGGGENPLQVSDKLQQRVPPTVNEIIPPTAAVPTPGVATAPATRPLGTRASATQSAATSPSIDALLANLPGVELDKMPELPVFPKPLANGKVRQTLNLDEAFNVALAQNRDYTSRKEDLYLAALNVALQRHVFEPQPFASSTVGISGGGEASDYAAAFSATQSVGVRQRLPYGGEIVAQALATSLQQVRKSIATSESNELTVTATIPLLRGAGSVAQEDLIFAERSMVYEVRDFERFRRGFLVTVAAQYFSLVNQRAQIVNRFSNVRSYIFITERSKALFEAGLSQRRTTLLDVMRAAQSEFQARSLLIGAIEQYEVALDQFKLLLGMPVDQPIDVVPQYLTIAPPNISEAQAVEIALRLRLDLQTIRDQVDDARRGVKNANNNMLPDLNLNANIGAGSNPRSLEPRYENLNYGSSVTLNLPLDRVPEQNALRAAQVGLDRSKRNVVTAESQVLADVRSSLRAVKQQQVVLAIQKSNIDLAQKRKAFSDIQFRDGKIDNRDYLDAETALLDAQNSFAKALSDLEVSVLQYLRNTDQLRVDFTGHLILPMALETAARGPATSAVGPVSPGNSPANPANPVVLPVETSPNR